MDIEYLFCGDTMLGAGHLRANPFARVESYVRAADIRFCNLETALSSGDVVLSKRHVIATPPNNLNYLRETGFDVVNLANNHTFDHGEAGCLRMIDELRTRDIQIVGLATSGRAMPVLIARKGVTTGFLGYADYGFPGTLMPLRERILLADVAELKRRVDCLVVSLHWGFEYVELPSPEQQRLARRLIDAGAHMVIGHHPHVAQGIEEYRGGLIAYSLGNFQFRIDLGDAFLSRGTGIMLSVQRSAEGRLSYKAIPVMLTGDEVEVRPHGDALFNMGSLSLLTAAVNHKRISYFRWLREASRLWLPASLESWFFRVKHFGSFQWVSMLSWLLRPTNLFCLFLYLVFPKHASSRALFRGHDA